MWLCLRQVGDEFLDGEVEQTASELLLSVLIASLRLKRSVEQQLEERREVESIVLYALDHLLAVVPDECRACRGILSRCVLRNRMQPSVAVHLLDLFRALQTKPDLRAVLELVLLAAPITHTDGSFRQKILVINLFLRLLNRI